MTTLSAVIPALNEENAIADIMQRVLAVQPQLPPVGVDNLELIVVDDGSTDRTAEIVAAMPGVKLVRHESNRGYGAALKTGFHHATGELLAFLDADGTYPPEAFPELCRQVLDGAELVVGSRRSGAASQMPLLRRIGNFLWSGLVTLLGNQRVVDPASGMRVFRREALARLYPLPDGLNFTPVMSIRAVHEGVRLVELPIPYQERVGRSKLSVVRDGTRFAQSIVWTALNYNPGRPLGLIGAGALALAALIGLALLAVRLSGVTSVGPLGAFALFAALILAVSGASFLALGISFNYFVALFQFFMVEKTTTRHENQADAGDHALFIGQSFMVERTTTGLENQAAAGDHALFIGQSEAIQQGPFKRPLHRHLGWLGLLALGVGVLLALISLLLVGQGWPVSRLWLYYLISASFTLVGIQLIVAWVQTQVLDALKSRKDLVADDLRGHSVLPERKMQEQPATWPEGQEVNA